MCDGAGSSRYVESSVSRTHGSIRKTCSASVMLSAISTLRPLQLARVSEHAILRTHKPECPHREDIAFAGAAG